MTASKNGGTICHRANGMSKIQIQVGLDPRMLDAVEARASRCGETRVEYIRRLIDADLRECGVEA